MTGARTAAGSYSSTASPFWSEGDQKSNPLGGRPGWVGYTGHREPVSVNLLPLRGQRLLFRFRFGTASDEEVGGYTGWVVDDVQVTIQAPCGLGAAPDGLTSAEVRRLVADVAAGAEVVGVTIAEFIPRQVIRLQQVLRDFPLLKRRDATPEERGPAEERVVIRVVPARVIPFPPVAGAQHA